MRQRREIARKHLTEEHQVVWWWTDGLVQGLGKRQVSHYHTQCYFIVCFVLSLFYVYGACGRNDFTLIVLWVCFPCFENPNSGHLVRRGCGVEDNILKATQWKEQSKLFISLSRGNQNETLRSLFQTPWTPSCFVRNALFLWRGKTRDIYRPEQNFVGHVWTCELLAVKVLFSVA